MYEDDSEKGPNYEQKKWEEERLGTARMRFGAKDAVEKNKDKDYDYVLEDQIDFVQGLQYLNIKSPELMGMKMSMTV